MSIQLESGLLTPAELMIVPVSHLGLSCIPAAGSSLKGPARLLRRAGDRAKRTEHAAVAVLGAQPRAALPTIIKKSASVDGHCFALREAAMRTGDDRMENDVIHRWRTLIQAPFRSGMV
jgi:hypothetical protein